MFKKLKIWLQKKFPNETTFNRNKIVYKTTELYLAKIMQLKLEEEGIPVIVINKRDTSYNSFGQIELYVREEHVIRAKYIIDKNYE